MPKCGGVVGRVTRQSPSSALLHDYMDGCRTEDSVNGTPPDSLLHHFANAGRDAHTHISGLTSNFWKSDVILMMFSWESHK